MNMKKLVAGVLACCIVGGVMPNVVNFADNAVITAGAVDEEEYTEGTYEQLKYKKYSDHIEISKCDREATEAVIPAEIEGLPVTIIGKSAFAFSAFTSISSRVLTSVTIPDSVTSIEDEAFSYCTNLTSIEIPNSVISIGNSVFESCENLTSMEIPNSVTSIGSGAFEKCTGLTSIEIPNSVTSIGSGAFKKCTGLTSIEIPNSVTSIGDEAFYGCTGLTSVTISDGVTSIGDNAFDGCTGLTSIEFPNSVTSIGDKAFYGCTGLTSINVSENNKNYSSADGVLFNKDKTELIQYPVGKTETKYVIPDSVTSIGKCAFNGCTGLISIEIPDSITSVEVSAFSGTSWLEEKQKENPLVIVGKVLIAGNKCSGDVIIPDGVISIGDYAFTC